jgi:hypothetical protein
MSVPLRSAHAQRVQTTPSCGRTVYRVNPWEPVPLSQAELPDRVTPTWVAEQFTGSPERFGRILRAHLVSSKKGDRRYTQQVRMLWRSVAFLDRRIRSRVLEMLQNWHDLAAAALADEDLDDANRRTLKHFSNDVAAAIQRVHREGREAMAWGGNEFISYPLNARIAIEALAVGIDEHRAGRLDNKDLYRLRRAGGRPRHRSHRHRRPRGHPRACTRRGAVRTATGNPTPSQPSRPLIRQVVPWHSGQCPYQ